MEEEFRKVGNRIKEMRKARSITQKQLAGALDISLTNMSNIETGKTAVTMQNLVKMKGIFSCEMKDFFDVGAEMKQVTEVNEAQEQVAEAADEPQAEVKEVDAKLPESIDLQDAINLLRLLRRIDIKGI